MTVGENDAWVEHGPTDPLSNEPTTREEEAFLAGFTEMIDKTVESRMESMERERVLLFLDELVKRWVAQEGVKQGYREVDAKTLGGRIYSFGSFRLGVHGPGADIDTLVLVPRHVTRELFFSTFYEMLKVLPQVSEIVPVPDAIVPVIKLIVSGIDVDLLFASLDLPSIPDNFEVLEDGVLKGVDEKTQRALNGPRVATQMLGCVPNVHTFRYVLRAVKLWAKNRRVYGNIVGYPGGVAWAVLTARVCQLYPNLSPAETFTKLFKYFSVWWKLPSERGRHESSGPIYLTRNLDLDRGFGFPVWNHKLNIRDRKDLFPVITPCYPYMNTCYNVTETTMNIILQEFKRGEALVAEMRDAHTKSLAAGGSPKPVNWDLLVEKTDFFVRYHTYLKVTVPAKDEDTGKKWAGFVESRIRRFFPQLEQIRDLKVHILPDLFTVKAPEGGDPDGAVVRYTMFLGMEVSDTKREIPLDTAWAMYMAHVTAPEAFPEGFKRTDAMMDPELAVLKRKELLATCAYALSDTDKQKLTELVLQARRDRKTKAKKRAAGEEDTSATPPAKAVKTLHGDKVFVPPLPAGKPPSAAKASADAQLPKPPPSPHNAPCAAPSPAKQVPDSPAIRPAGTPPCRPNVPGKVSSSTSPGGHRATTPGKVKSLTDKLIADAYGF